ncbi:hypothetical protein R1flu_006048 [Riccia fluitans]|uniref:Secreted protein n=1 Tax=Riccia fluitans TaxID=41844 RepID=A0ABD1YXQ9_9MARC
MAHVNGFTPWVLHTARLATWFVVLSPYEAYRRGVLKGSDLVPERPDCPRGGSIQPPWTPLVFSPPFQPSAAAEPVCGRFVQ